MAKEANFGGIPTGELSVLVAFWSSKVRPGGLTDAQWITQLGERIDVLAALVTEEHAAANPGDNVDLVGIVMKCVDVRQMHRDVIGGGPPPATLVAVINQLEKLWDA